MAAAEARSLFPLVDRLFSMARAAPAVRDALGLPVLTTPESAVRALRARLA